MKVDIALVPALMISGKEINGAMMITTIVDVNLMVGIAVDLKSIRLTAKNVNARERSPDPNPDPLNLHV